MSDGHLSLQIFQNIPVENIFHQPHCLVDFESTFIINAKSGTLLAPVLQGQQSQIGQRRKVINLFRVIDPENSAFLSHFIIRDYISICEGIVSSHILFISFTFRLIQSLISSLPSSVTSPSTVRGTALSAAIFFILSRSPESMLIITLLWLSEKSSPAAVRPVVSSILILAPILISHSSGSKQLSARASASPPSEQSWADLINPFLIPFRTVFCKAFSLSISSSGGLPFTRP